MGGLTPGDTVGLKTLERLIYYADSKYTVINKTAKMNLKCSF